MRVLIVAHSLPHALTLEQTDGTGPVARTVLSTTHVLSPALHASSSAHQHEKDAAPRPRRQRSHSTASPLASVSLIGCAEADLPDSDNAPQREPLATAQWKFAEILAHPSRAAASGLPDDCERVFLGWPGPFVNEHGRRLDYTALPETTLEQVRSLYWSETGSVPVLLEAGDAEAHMSYCNETLWPVLHYVLWDSPTHCTRILHDWNAYVRVNEVFADKILDVFRTGDLIWILDHHLLLLPALLRRKLQKTPIGLYLRATFPSSELFRCLPQAADILLGILGAHVVGFQAHAYARHFNSCCTRLLGLETSLQRIDYEGAPVELTVAATGIDPRDIARLLRSDETRDKIRRFSAMYQGLAVLVGVDWSNQWKGLRHKLKALEHFLLKHPEWNGRVVLVQVVLPEWDMRPHAAAASGERGGNGSGTNAHLAQERHIIDEAARINDRFGRIGYTPVHLYNQNIELVEYYSLLQVANVYISTVERDSISLAPLDFVYCQEAAGRCGPVILSEFTALSGSLSAAFRINPWDHVHVAETINAALTASAQACAARHQILLGYLMQNTTHEWSRTLLDKLLASRDMIDLYGPTAYLDFSRVSALYSRAQRRYFFLDYDGTLTPIVKTPAAAVPGLGALQSLRRLTADPRNHVYVISGRDRATLESWLGDIARLGMSAEHGCFLRPVDASEWINLIEEHEDEEWKAEVLQVFEYFTERTPGSFIERKSASITWHYRLADPEFGSWQAHQCQSLLESTISGKKPVEVLAGKKNLEVRPLAINKGGTLRRILLDGDCPSAGFVFCAGDDRTDEDMFRVLMELSESPTAMDIVACSIGAAEKKTLARYYVNNSEQLVHLLYQLTE